jgi:hypothetical protein
VTSRSKTIAALRLCVLDGNVTIKVNRYYDLVSSCYTAGQYVHILGWYRVVFLLNFDIDNCLLKKIHYSLGMRNWNFSFF